jgi:hypothetical protein
MYEPGKIMRCGGGNPGVDTTWVVDLTIADAQWIVADAMNKARRNHNLVILPDGKVLAVGGNTSGNTSGPILEPEIFDPAAGTWLLQPPMDANQPRRYHSTAMLLPDGRVVAAGGEPQFKTGQIFNPPYTQVGDERPIITNAPTSMQYGQMYSVFYDGPTATKACLIRLASVTHGFDMDQRRVPLQILSETEPGHLIFNAPANGNIAPPGWYMLFILNEYAVNKFAPCEMAAYVQVGP